MMILKIVRIAAVGAATGAALTAAKLSKVDLVVSEATEIVCREIGKRVTELGKAPE